MRSFSGEWIWENSKNRKDEHAEFKSVFVGRAGDRVRVYLSCDTDFALYLNGALIGFGQYPDYPHYKVFEQFDLSERVKTGENVLAIEAYHGGDSSTHYAPRSGLIFEVARGEEIIARSGADTQSRLSRTYASHREKFVSGQIGYSYACDLTKADGWKSGEAEGFHESVVLNGAKSLLPRPISRLKLGEVREGVAVENDRGVLIYDLLCEEAGYPVLTAIARTPVTLRLSWGEHLLDGAVRSKIQERDFSVEITLPAGKTDFTAHWVRFGARYLQIEGGEGCEIVRCGLRLCNYPVTVVASPRLETPLRKRIYDTCVKTLRLCMHDHYEDCPWREQAMYALDSRHQMLGGYFAFGEHAFPRAALELMCNDPEVDGFMSICFPADSTLKIPSFSLYFFMQMWEYAHNSGDLSLCERYFDRLQALLEKFLVRFENGISPNFFDDASFWNFYEWTDGMEGKLFRKEAKRFDLPLNCLLSIAMQKTDEIRLLLGKERVYSGKIEELNGRINDTFFSEEKGVYRDFSDGEHFSALGNALAVLCGAADGARRAAVCGRLADEAGGLIPASLSMLPFVYDALLLADRKGYAKLVLDDIDEKYGKMLAAGATSFWETLDGAEAFGGAGSLCHGWSAMPVYYYRLLEGESA